MGHRKSKFSWVVVTWAPPGYFLGEAVKTEEEARALWQAHRTTGARSGYSKRKNMNKMIERRFGA
jgi:hypothetical protein